MKTGHTNKPVAITYCGKDITIPQGTRVLLPRNNPVGDYAVESIDLLVQLTGNRHDPHYRYAWIKAEDVTLEGVYGEMCRSPEICAGKGYCPRDPACND